MNPTKRDPARTRGNLLRAGVILFAERGYDGVAVDEIVTHAGCNKRMLYHYFASKDGLYVEVLRDVFSALEREEVATLDRSLPWQEAIRTILRGSFAYLEGHPEFVSLLMWENLRGGKFLDAHPGLLSKSPVVHRLEAILKSARQRGEVGPVKAKELLLLLYGVCFIHFSNRHTLRHTMGIDLRSPAVRQSAVETCEQIILRGLANS